MKRSNGCQSLTGEPCCSFSTSRISRVSTIPTTGCQLADGPYSRAWLQRDRNKTFTGLSRSSLLPPSNEAGTSRTEMTDQQAVQNHPPMNASQDLPLLLAWLRTPHPSTCCGQEPQKKLASNATSKAEGRRGKATLEEKEPDLWTASSYQHTTVALHIHKHLHSTL